jgi:SNF2 family DNA or RNA helicase
MSSPVKTQIDLAVAFEALADERKDVEALLFLARDLPKPKGTDAKAEALLELIYKIQQEENDPDLKVLVFTEFVPTQAMLADFFESRGFSVVTLNGSMDLEPAVADPEIILAGRPDPDFHGCRGRRP